MEPEFEPPRSVYSLPRRKAQKQISKSKAKRPKAIASQVETVIASEAARREAFFIAEMCQLKGVIERYRNETAELRRESDSVVRELDEDRRNARARIARLEELIRTRPKTMWERVKAAFGVLAGQSSAIPLLPAPREELQKAA